MIEKIQPIAKTYSEAAMLTPAQIAEYLFFLTGRVNQIIDKVNKKQRKVLRKELANIRLPYKD